MRSFACPAAGFPNFLVLQQQTKGWLFVRAPDEFVALFAAEKVETGSPLLDGRFNCATHDDRAGAEALELAIKATQVIPRSTAMGKAVERGGRSSLIEQQVQTEPAYIQKPARDLAMEVLNRRITQQAGKASVVPGILVQPKKNLKSFGKIACTGCMKRLPASIEKISAGAADVPAIDSSYAR